MMRGKQIRKEGIYCGQDFKELIGFRIVKVISNKYDSNVRVVLSDENGNYVKLYFDDICFDGELLKEKRWQKPDNKENDGKGQPFRIPLTSEKGVKNNGKK